jgi:hypothetical protein
MPSQRSRRSMRRSTRGWKRPTFVPLETSFGRCEGCQPRRARGATLMSDEPIIDVWCQHPTPSFFAHEMFASLRRWIGHDGRSRNPSPSKRPSPQWSRAA